MTAANPGLPRTAPVVAVVLAGPALAVVALAGSAPAVVGTAGVAPAAGLPEGRSIAAGPNPVAGSPTVDWLPARGSLLCFVSYVSCWSALNGARPGTSCFSSQSHKTRCQYRYTPLSQYQIIYHFCIFPTTIALHAEALGVPPTHSNSGSKALLALASLPEGTRSDTAPARRPGPSNSVGTVAPLQ